MPSGLNSAPSLPSGLESNTPPSLPAGLGSAPALPSGIEQTEATVKGYEEDQEESFSLFNQDEPFINVEGFMANAIEDKRMLELISFPLKATRIGCAEARSASFGD
jgi:hypothetical protein